jgi:excisionase family DNA binding protein
MNKGLTSTEAAARLGISTARVRRLVLDGRLRAEKFGRDLVIYEADLQSFERLKGGRPAKSAPGTEKRATGHASARHGTSAGKQKGRKK